MNDGEARFAIRDRQRGGDVLIIRAVQRECSMEILRDGAEVSFPWSTLVDPAESGIATTFSRTARGSIGVKASLS